MKFSGSICWSNGNAIIFNGRVLQTSGTRINDFHLHFHFH